MIASAPQHSAREHVEEAVLGPTTRSEGLTSFEAISVSSMYKRRSIGTGNSRVSLWVWKPGN